MYIAYTRRGVMKQIPESYYHQTEALEFIRDKPVFALFMEQGTGKTKVVIMKSEELYSKGLIDRILIVSPNGIKEQWVTEQFKEHYPNEDWKGLFWEGMSTLREKNEFLNLLKFPGLKVWSINIDALQSDTIDQYITMFLAEGSSFMVVDESTRIKNGRRKPKRGKRGGAKSANKILDISKAIIYKGILTGTPSPNSPFDLWSQFEFLESDFFKLDFYFFQHKYGIMLRRSVGAVKFNSTIDEKTYNFVKSSLKKHENLTPSIVEAIADQHGMKTADVIKIKGMDKYSPYKNLEELRQQISKVTFFKRKEECLDLPDKVYEKLYVKMSKEQSDLYGFLKREMYAEYETKELTVTSKVVMTLRLQMITGGLFPYENTEMKVTDSGEEYFDREFKYKDITPNAKLKILLEDLEEVPDYTFIIVWAVFTGEIKTIHSALIEAGYTAEQYRGGSSNDVIDRFKAGEFRILVANPYKGSEGLNLQIATLHYFYSNSFKADKRLQAEDRSHRIGQKNTVLYKDIICKGTVDERVYDVLKRKESLIDYFRRNPEIDI